MIAAQLKKQKETEDSQSNITFEGIPASVQIRSNDTIAPIPFNAPIYKNDMSDCYDEKRLLKLVPKKCQDKAENLLKAFDVHANELTWDSAGINNNFATLKA